MLRVGLQTGLRNLLCSSTKLSVLKVTRQTTLVSLTTQSVRYTSFFNTLPADQLWKGVTSVSNAGKKRGRGKGSDRKGKKNLNTGQRVGVGKVQIDWPGLNCPLFEHSTPNTIKYIDTSEVKTANKDVMQKRLRQKKLFSSPLERGWSGGRRVGKSAGIPDPTDEYKGFESVILELRLKSMLTSILGRKKFFNVLVATGNGNGLIGIGRALGGDSNACLRLARNRAAKRLLHIDLLHRDSVNHDFVSSYGCTRVVVEKRPPGFGLVCHRAIKALCKLIGIKNIYAKIEGPINFKHVIRAFIVGLMKQKSFQEIADETKLHLVEFQEERFNYPEVLASPTESLSLAEARKKNVNLEQFLLGGILYRKPKPPPFFVKLPSYKTYLKRTLYKRNHDQVKINLLVEYGTWRSHLFDKYPECCRKLGVNITSAAEPVQDNQ